MARSCHFAPCSLAGTLRRGARAWSGEFGVTEWLSTRKDSCLPAARPSLGALSSGGPVRQSGRGGGEGAGRMLRVSDSLRCMNSA